MNSSYWLLCNFLPRLKLQGTRDKHNGSIILVLFFDVLEPLIGCPCVIMRYSILGMCLADCDLLKNSHKNLSELHWKIAGTMTYCSLTKDCVIVTSAPFLRMPFSDNKNKSLTIIKYSLLSLLLQG